VSWAVGGLEVETPSWGYGNSGTSFKVFPQPGVPRDPFEKVEDAATVGRFTGVAKSIALHIPWDRVDDFDALAAFARERGVRIGGINSNTFQDEDYKLGSLCHPSLEVRKKAVAHVLECCEIARKTGSSVVKVWLADGTNYPGQDDFRARRGRLIETLREIYAGLPDRARLLLEYKFYEPAFYHTDVQDWGQALSVCQQVGQRAQVCVHTGHRLLKDAYDTDVRPLLARARADAGLPEDPYRAYLASGEDRQREQSRVGGVGAGWQ
jgi:L-rhamnose isomerase/sugar isomerase